MVATSVSSRIVERGVHGEAHRLVEDRGLDTAVDHAVMPHRSGAAT